VSNQRRAGFVAGGSDESGGRHGGQVSQNELFRRRETKRHANVMDDHIAKAGVPEKAAKLIGVAERARDDAADGGLGADVALKPFAQR
jgi:hypothetical protein